MNDMPDASAARDHPSKDAVPTRKRTIVIVTIALAAILAIGAGVGVVLLNQPRATATAPATAEATVPTETETPSPTGTAPTTPTPSPEPPEEPGAPLPENCREIYTPEFLEIWADVELNDPSLDDVVISRFDGVEKAREGLPGIECKWGVPTEGGMSTAVNRTTAEQKNELVAAAMDDGFTCTDDVEFTVCAFSEGPFADDPDGWVNSEELYFRDGLVVTTWRASTIGTMADSTQPVYDTLWP